MTNAAEFARAIGAKSYGNGKYLGSCTNPGHPDKTASMIISDGFSGGVILNCLAGCDWRDVKAGAEARGIIEPFKPGHIESPTSKRERIERQNAASVQREKEQAEQDKAGTAKAKKLWGECILLAGMGKECLESRRLDWPCQNLKTHENIYCAKTGKKEHAYIFLLRDGISGKGRATHAVYVARDEFGIVQNIKPKISTGPMAGAAIQLAPAKGVLALAEGPETAMAYRQLTGSPTWATCGTANLSKVNIPPIVTRLIIAGDNDEKGREAAQKAAATYAEQGFNVEIHLPPTEGHDWNNVLIEGVSA